MDILRQEDFRARISSCVRQRRHADKLHRLTMILSGVHGYTAVACAFGLIGAFARDGWAALCFLALVTTLSGSAALHLWTTSRSPLNLNVWTAVVSILVIGALAPQAVLLLANIAAIVLALWLQDASSTDDLAT